MEKLFEDHDFLIADPKLISYDALDDMIGDDYIIREQDILYRIWRSFNMEDLYDINSQVEEEVFISCTIGIEEFDKDDIEVIRSLGLFSFDKDDMEVSNEQDTYSTSVVFEKKMTAYIIDHMSIDDVYISIRLQADMELSDKDLNNIIEYLEDRDINIYGVTDEQIRDAMENMGK